LPSKKLPIHPIRCMTMPLSCVCVCVCDAKNHTNPFVCCVFQSRLCDGGMQEMSTAVACVREIFPDATIKTTRREPREDIGISNPSVVISVDDSSGSGIGKTPNNNNSNEAAAGRRRSSTSTISSLGPDSDVLWSAKQKNLYEKYPKKRRRSIKDIRKSLEAFRDLQELEELEEEDDDASADLPGAGAGAAPLPSVGSGSATNDHHHHQQQPTDEELPVAST